MYWLITHENQTQSRSELIVGSYVDWIVNTLPSGNSILFLKELTANEFNLLLQSGKF